MITAVKTALSTWEIRSAPLPPPGAKATIAASPRMIAMLRIMAVLTAYRVPASGAQRIARRRDHDGGDGHVARLRHHAVGELGSEAVSHAEVRVDVAPPGRRLLELLAQLAHEHVDRPVAAGHRIAPDALVDLLALEHASLGVGEELDQLELAPGELDALAADVRLEQVGADLDVAGQHRSEHARRRRPPAPPDD